MGNTFGVFAPSTAIKRREDLRLFPSSTGDRNKDVAALATSMKNAGKKVKTHFLFSIGGSGKRSVDSAASPQATPKRLRSQTRAVTPPPNSSLRQDKFRQEHTNDDTAGATYLPRTTEMPLRRCLLEHIEALSEGCEIVLVMSPKVNKFCDIRRVVGQNISNHSVMRLGQMRYEFKGRVVAYHKRDLVSSGFASPNEINKWVRDGDGFTVALDGYPVQYPVRMKDIYSLAVEIWQQDNPNSSQCDFFYCAGRSRNPSVYGPILQRYLQEVEGDRYQTQLVIQAFHRKRYETLELKLAAVVKEKIALQAALDKTDFNKLLPVLVQKEMDSDASTSFIEYVDNEYKNALCGHYEDWQEINAPLLTDQTEDTFISMWQTDFPICAKFFDTAALTVRNQLPSEQLKDHVHLKKVKAFHSFLSLMRIKNPFTLVHWAVCDALGQLSRGTAKVAHQQNIWRRFSVSYATAFKVLNEISSKAEKSIRKLLISEQNKSVMIDNHQQVLDKKLHRGGTGTEKLDGTVRIAHRHKQVPLTAGSVIYRKDLRHVLFLVESCVPVNAYVYTVRIKCLVADQTDTMTWPRKKWRVLHLHNADKVEGLTYINQHVPRSTFMRKPVETYSHSIIFASFPSIFAEASDTQGFTTLSTKDYMASLRSSRRMTSIERYLRHLPVLPKEAQASNSNIEKKPYKLDPLLEHDFRNFGNERYFIAKTLEKLDHMFIKASSFQASYVHSWNPLVEKVDQLLYMKMSEHDEITTKGAMQMLIQLLCDVGLTNKIGNGNYEAADDVDDQNLSIWGDCVTADTLNRVEDRIFELLSFPGKEKYVATLLTALDRVREMQGDFHIGMHMLAVIFKYFYPGCIQVVQALIRQKRVQLNPLPRYQQSRDIVKIMYEELERLRTVTWAKDTKLGCNNGRDAILPIPGDILTRYKDDENINSTLTSDKEVDTLNFEQIMQHMEPCDQLMTLDNAYSDHMNKQAISSDEYVRLMSQFMTLTDSFLLYLDSIRCGDAIACESIMIQWLPIFRAAGRHRNVGLIIRMQETNYVKLSAYELEEIRWNRSIRLNKGRAMMAKDDICELVNLHSKEMGNFKLLDSLVQRSIHIPLFRRCARSVGAIGLRHTKCQSSIHPQRVRERRAIYALFSKAGVWTERKGRVITEDFMWDHFKDVSLITERAPKDEKNPCEYEEKVKEMFFSLSKKETVGLTEEELIEIGTDLVGEKESTTEEREASRSSTTTLEPNDGVELLTEAPELDNEDPVSQEDLHDKGMIDTEHETTIQELSQMKRYKLDVKTARKDIVSEGKRLLGTDMAEQRKKLLDKKMRKRAQILEAAQHYAEMEENYGNRLDVFAREVQQAEAGDMEVDEWEAAYKRECGKFNVT